MDPETEERIKKIAANQARQRELARFSQDIIRVYNPLDIDFRFLYDGYPNTVKSKTYKDMERFKARLYVRKIVQYMIGRIQDIRGNELLKKREERGQDQILDKYQESMQIWMNVPKLDDKQLTEDIFNQVIVGLVEEYGLEEPLPEQKVQPRSIMTSPEEELFAKMTKVKIADDKTQPEVKPVKPLSKEVRIDE